ncbi:hypothetical protein [Anaerocolumna chitinilytica]|uniref:Uncharacterized protein n=1 Tax=Anaerocolumna chitinilytica TaxID=1727145 RepID=A0A7I8DLB2_9FIRM|nr:hypothetical protein [Anaerocolumna chitinilytica]BCJ98081.1 hypothetical protein bsdcttw_11220 [Anaerocolumna chitinilytica]
MSYAVEAKIFNSGQIVARVRPARTDDMEGCTETRTCDVWIDLFDDLSEAEGFKKSYTRA